ncbi:MAG: type III-A CRISPR-associated protein Csm2 [Gammaproteobacteria bacterium]|nr:type III-A CRISPR-associated protein Csm2 [Gammaproteobacteria bacterium]
MPGPNKHSVKNPISSASVQKKEAFSSPSQGKHSASSDHQSKEAAKTDEAHLIFSPVHPELFNSVARQAAELVAENHGANKPSQLRKFYDELCMWETKVSAEPARFNDYLPFILMLNAKLAYAKGRKLVDQPFVQLIGDCLKQVKDPETLRICKLFFEAFLGFYKERRPSDK